MDRRCLPQERHHPLRAPSLQMVFGKRPPPLSEDPAAQQPCLASCATAVVGAARCHKLD